MEQNYEIYHHGIKGQKWGIRRFQNKDGSLTKAGKKRRGIDDKEEKKETDEQIRARVLKSTNAQEIYENRHLLSTNEINERLTRLDTERRLSDVADKNKVTVNKRVKKVIATVKETADNIEAAYQITQMPFVKALAKKLKGETTEDFDMEKAIANIDKMSNEEVGKLQKRLTQTKLAKDTAQSMADASAAKKKAAQAESDASSALDRWRQTLKKSAEQAGKNSQAYKDYVNFSLTVDLAESNGLSKKEALEKWLTTQDKPDNNEEEEK